MSAPATPADLEMELALGELEALREAKELYAEFFQYAPDALVITDAAGNVQEANEAALELLQAKANSLVGMPLSRCVEDAGVLRVALEPRASPLMSGAPGLCWLISPLG